MKMTKFLVLALGLMIAMPMFLTAEEEEVEIQLVEVMGSLPGDNPLDGPGQSTGDPTRPTDFRA